MIGDTASKRWRIAIDFLALISAAALILSGWALYDRFSGTNHARAENKRVWHAVICSIEQAVYKNKTLTVVKKRDANQMWEASEILDQACEACHRAYWYPGENAEFYKKLHDRLDDYTKQQSSSGTAAPKKK